MSKLSVETINMVVAEAAAKTGLPIETVEKCWDALCSALEPFVRYHVERAYDDERGVKS
jgi:hypothetical protein